MVIVVWLILSLALWVGTAMAFAAIPAWLVMLILGAAGCHVGYIPCLLVGTVFSLFFCETKVSVRY